MREKTVIFKRYCIAALVMLILSVRINSSIAQDLSNGTIDFIFKPDNNWNQLAIWIEDGSGEFIATAYLTNFIGRQGGGNRTSDPDIDSGNGNRLSALPIWAYKRNVIDTAFGIENYYPPAETQSSYPDDMDAVSGATPDQSVQTKTRQLSNLPYGEYNCWIEANRSFDTNEYHNYSYYRGQPSVVWNITIHVGDTSDSSMILDYTGYGSPDGSDGNINAPDSTITTAANLLNDLGGYKFKIVYSPGTVGVKYNPDDTTPVQSFMLDQNYPNPFNSFTKITYSIPQSDFVILKIYNRLGQEILTLANQFQKSGDYTIRFDAINLSSGIYFYKLHVGSFVKTKKMILMR